MKLFRTRSRQLVRDNKSFSPIQIVARVVTDQWMVTWSPTPMRDAAEHVDTSDTSLNTAVCAVDFSQYLDWSKWA